MTGIALTGCRHYYVGVEPPPPDKTSPGPLTIDVHCHIFNGTDLQVKDFLSDTDQGFGSPEILAIAQEIVWGIGTTGDIELRALKGLAVQLGEPVAGTCPAATRSTLPMDDRERERLIRSWTKLQRQALYQRGKQAIKDAKDMRRKKTKLSEEQERVHAQVDQYLAPDQYDELPKPGEKAEQPPADAKAVIVAEPKCRDPLSIVGAIQTLVDYFQPRMVLAQLYLDTFCPSAHRDVDLMMPALVDYDWWLSGGTAPVTDLKTQVAVMEQISILSRGRIHGYVPFCPLRAVAHRFGKADWCPLDLVKDAITTRGFIGVKLYPPMGFAPYGNAQLGKPTYPPKAVCPPGPLRSLPYGNSGYWVSNCNLPDWAFGNIHYSDDGTDGDLGTRLDQALYELYDWCIQNGVPILAHSDQTNGIDKNFTRLASAEFWRNALQQFPALQIDFGHLGSMDNFETNDCSDVGPPAATMDFIALMGDGRQPPTAPGATYKNIYGDAAFDATILNHNADFMKRLRKAYGISPLPDRFLYGTDWSLLLHTGRNSEYMKRFEREIETASPSVGGAKSIQDRFLGWNAVDYAGLAANKPTRNRLDRFYQCYGMKKPTWAVKVDGPTPAAQA